MSEKIPVRNKLFWPLIALILAIAISIISGLFALYANLSYQDERNNDPLWRENALLKRELMRMYVINQMLSEDVLNSKTNKPKPQKAF